MAEAQEEEAAEDAADKRKARTKRGAAFIESGEYDESNDNLLMSYVINEQCVNNLIEMEAHPPLKNIKTIEKYKAIYG